MTEYETRPEAIEALLEYVAGHPLCCIMDIKTGWRTQYHGGAIESFLFPAPRVIPPDLTTVWVRDEEDDVWVLTHSAGTTDGVGRLLCHNDVSGWVYWTTEEPEGWRK